MSETAKNADTAKRAADHSVRSGQAAMDAASKTTRDAIDETSQAAKTTAEQVKEASYTVAETMAETANAATDMSSKAAEQGRDVMMMGMRTAAGVGGRVGDIGFGRGHRLMTSAARAMDVYRDATERSAERVQGLFASAMVMGRGLQHMQHAWLEMMDHSMEHASHKPQDLLRCNNLVEVAEVQRDLYVDAVNHAFESTSRLLEMAGRTVQDAVRPLQSHPH